MARQGQLSLDAIRGTTTSPAAGRRDLRRALLHLRDRHEGPCNLATTRILWKRMGTAGVSNDLNSVVRSLAVAIRDSFQLVLLPPSLAVRERLRVDSGVHLSQDRPWHWLDERMPLSSVLRPSSCQRLLQEQHAHVLDALGANSSDARVNAARLLGLGSSQSRDHDQVNHLWYVELQLDGYYPVVPQRFRRHGMLWWFAALTTYLIRVKGRLAQRLRSHPAMAPFVDAGAAHGSSDEHQGWTPSARFDVGIHVRQGDACGSDAQAKAHPLRRCMRGASTALHALAPVAAIPKGSIVFVASDSEAVIAQARTLRGPPLLLQPHFLNLSRTKYSSGLPVERALARNDGVALEEALMELLLLSRSRVVVAQMMGNMPRLALQMQVRPPGTWPAYVSLDGNQWCTCSSCKETYWVTDRRTGLRKREFRRGYVEGATDVPRRWW